MRRVYPLLVLLTFSVAVLSAVPFLPAGGGGKQKSGGNLYLLTITVETHDHKNGTPDDFNFTADILEQVVTNDRPEP
jgi:hypothetical protein